MGSWRRGVTTVGARRSHGAACKEGQKQDVVTYSCASDINARNRDHAACLPFLSCSSCGSIFFSSINIFIGEYVRLVMEMQENIESRSSRKTGSMRGPRDTLSLLVSIKEERVTF